jgi:hypothetical protein
MTLPGAHVPLQQSPSPAHVVPADLKTSFCFPDDDCFSCSCAAVMR